MISYAEYRGPFLSRDSVAIALHQISVGLAKEDSMSLLFVFLLILSSQAVQAADSSQAEFVGCLSRLPDGILQFGMLRSGEVYSIEGNTEPLIGHANQLVRILGRAEPSGDRNRISKLMVISAQVIADTCTAGLGAAKAQAVEGKAGEGQVAIPVTTTATDETTPGFQTEGAMIQLSGAEGRGSARVEHPATPPYSPVEPEQAAESELAADVNAQAAARAEILPGITLGANAAAVPNPPAGSAGSSSNRAVSMSPSGAGTVVVEITGGEIASLSFQRVNIKVGGSIEWKNTSGYMHEIIANPAKAKPHAVPSLPAGASPFDSGFIRPDHSFSHLFTVPGVYRYVCDLNDPQNNPQPVMGEIVVAP